MKLFTTTSVLLLLSLISGFVTAADTLMTTARGAQYKDLKPGTGTTAQIGDVVTIHFVGWIDSNGVQGKKIYNTRAQRKPVSFVVGTDKVMPGWNDGVIGMRQGGKRLVMLPPALAYGTREIENVIPANASLIFVIDLLQLEKYTGQ